MAADDLITKGARSSAATILTYEQFVLTYDVHEPIAKQYMQGDKMHFIDMKYFSRAEIIEFT